MTNEKELDDKEEKPEEKKPEPSESAPLPFTHDDVKTNPSLWC